MEMDLLDQSPHHWNRHSDCNLFLEDETCFGRLGCESQKVRLVRVFNFRGFLGGLFDAIDVGYVGGLLSDFLVLTFIGGVLYEWNSWRTIVPLLLGLVGIGATGYYEYWLSTKAFDADGNAIPGDHIQPIIRFGIFHNWTMRLLYLQTFIHGVILWALLYYLPLYYEAVKGYRPVIAGVSLLPETLLIARMSFSFEQTSSPLTLSSNVHTGRSCEFQSRVIPVGYLGRMGLIHPGIWFALSARY